MRRLAALSIPLLGLPLFLGVAGIALAQPVRLTPTAPAPTAPAQSQPQDEQKQEQPAAQQAPVQQTNVPPAGNPPAGATAPKTGVVAVETLNAPDPSSVGMLGDDNGGLGIKMWAGTSRTQAERVISLLPAPIASPALRQLQRRLLLTTAEAPAGQSGGILGNGEQSLLGLRVRQLYRLGLSSEAADLGTPKPQALRDRVFTQLPINLALQKHDFATACPLGARALAEEPSEAAWLRVAVFCRFKNGEAASGELALSLWRDQGGEDTAFQALAAIMGGDNRVKVEKLAHVDPLIVAMLRETKRPLPPGSIEIAPAGTLAAIADLPDLDPEMRLNALGQAVALGAIPPQRLASAYAQLEITEAQRADILAGKLKGARAAAFLFQQARQLNAPGPQRAEALKRVYDLAAARGTLFMTAAVLRDTLRDLPAEPESLSAAPAVIRLALAAGETGTARLWRNSLMSQTDPALAAIAAQTWPLLVLVEPPAAWPEAQFQGWSETLKALPPQRKAALQAMVLILAEAGGVPVPAETWQMLIQPGLETSSSNPPVAYWRNLLRASEANARAETVALALILLGDNLAKDDPATLATAFGALKRLKLDTEVRALALEAALLRGL
ncbi:hypothetical protein [Ferrovibrio sp.]|uniref:hypothetical protein n=1 Tax=Ferrovibrio sp. TaxID=1917215 RepID=UPI003D11153D